jgi:hypothetical protein
MPWFQIRGSVQVFNAKLLPGYRVKRTDEQVIRIDRPVEAGSADDAILTVEGEYRWWYEEVIWLDDCEVLELPQDRQMRLWGAPELCCIRETLPE